MGVPCRSDAGYLKLLGSLAGRWASVQSVDPIPADDAAAAVGGVGAMVLQALGRPLEARATNGDPVLVGGSYTATTVTKISSSADIVSIEARNSSAGSTGVGLRAHSINGTAIQASSSNLTPVVRPDTTIYGFHNGAQLGHTPVVARFEATEQSSGFATAIALQVVGKTQFMKSGVATVPSGVKKVTVAVSQLSAGSFAFATLQQARSGIHVSSGDTMSPASTITP